MRIGIIRLGSLGDIIHALPALAALRRRFPRDAEGRATDHRIEWMVESGHSPFLSGHPLLDAVHVLDTKQWRRMRAGARGPFRSLREIRARRFNAILDLQGLLKSGLLARWTGAPRRIGFAAEQCREPAAARFYTDRVASAGPEKHVVEKNLSLLEPLGIEGPVRIEFPLGLTDSDRAKAAACFPEWGWGPETPVIALHPGAGWETKRWGTDRFAALGEGLVQATGARLLLVGGPGDEGQLESLARQLKDRGAVIPATSVREMAAFLERVHLFIGGDTGPLHLAAALGIPTVAILGPTTPSRNGPMGPGARRGTVIHHELPCSHCYQRVCPGFGNRCLTEITVDEAVEVSLKVWNRSLQKTES